MNYNYNNSEMIPIQNGSVARLYTGQQAYCVKKCTPFLKNQSSPWKDEKYYEVRKLDGTTTYETRNSSGNPIYIMDENGNKWEDSTLQKFPNYSQIPQQTTYGGVFNLKRFLKIFKPKKPIKSKKTTTTVKKPTKPIKSKKTTTTVKKPTKPIKSKKTITTVKKPTKPIKSKKTKTTIKKPTK